ncbi:methionine synthase [Elstera cyanobacteriorum]|uniref:Methionine synthase n=1 Tax=Elstera cyanobacteriorum TaxID=2022747 RepID=A0A255XN99_9PROT|nr:methionine synthase [Elstera cyanobacteriorum]OYQ18458.1 methionine synthase [Elstera cyanobacteriorum]GFZ80133.1 methionine synthase [Elstera cyanobacteriorum]
MADFLTALKQRVLLCDGGTGALVQAMDLDLERDFLGQENCTEVLNKSRPDIVREIHGNYYGAGSDVVQTNSFGGSPLTLAEFGLQDEAFEINRLAASHANDTRDQFKADGRQRFILGSIGPGTRLPSLGHIDYQSLEDSFHIQAAGLIAGGVDGVLIETCQDPLQIKAAVNGTKRARKEAARAVPLLVQVTVETTGTLLVGADIAAAATVIHSLDVDVMGLNCATGPQEMAEHVKWLGENWPGLISVQPNAGLPELVDGKTHYPLSPQELATWLERFIREDGINMVGGCCGTRPDHIRALDGMLRRLDPQTGNSIGRPVPKARVPQWVPSVASLYSAVPLRQENAYLSIGERCNANGSKKFRELQEAGDWDGCVAMAREQVKEGSHTLDLCTAFVGRNEVEDMTQAVSRMRGSVNAPLVIDSTELPVLEAALKLYGGKAILNSINFEDGEGPAEKRMELAKRFGAAVVALTIDEEGMAKDVERKLEIARRLYDFAVNRYGLPASDLMFDPLTFTICTGNEDDRKLGLWTLDAIERIATEMPECQIVLGLSNISFGLNPAARHVLNSVFLDHAVRRGMTGAIVHLSKITPLHKIPEEEVRVAEDLIFDRRREGYDPLQAFIALFEGRQSAAKVAKKRAETVEERLKDRIIDGDRLGLEEDLAEAMKAHPPLDIINIFLLDGMKVVGELFGAGKMQLPFVLQSAETMKTAVAYLEPFMEKIEGQEKGTIVLATVKGDVHDIGKNLVDIILTNNGYRVVNLGIKQPIATIIQATKEHKADAIGMSGLLVKSTVIMKDNLEELRREGLETPVLLGGAALTRKFVEEDCVTAYGGKGVAYARDAFDGLALMDKVVGGSFESHVAETQEKRANRPTNTKRILGQAANAERRPVDAEEIRLRRQELNRDVTPPVPPFWGPRVLARVPAATLVPYLNETMLFQFQWGFRKMGKSLDEFKAWAAQEVKPILKRMLDLCAAEEILQPQAVYGYWKCAGDGNDVVLFEEDGVTEAGRFTLPRQAGDQGLCIADFFRDIHDPQRDVIGLQVVTMGQKVADTARAWFAENRYQDYLYLHGLGVEMAEAMAEYVHKRIRGELGFAAEDDRDMEKMLKQGYRGSRYSFGYPACPNLADQHLLMKLLNGQQIGVDLSDEDQLHPEQSTSAIVVLHPQAKYFSV